MTLFGYGSLMNPIELANQGLSARALHPVRVRGYRRSFTQEPSWRVATGADRAVLRVDPDPDGWLNGILVGGFTAEDVAGLDLRERGYDRVAVPARRVESYRPASGPPAEDLVLYAGKPELWNGVIRPNADYLSICLEGAAEWGAEFHDDFLRTTFLGSGESLKEAGSPLGA